MEEYSAEISMVEKMREVQYQKELVQAAMQQKMSNTSTGTTQMQGNDGLWIDMGSVGQTVISGWIHNQVIEENTFNLITLGHHNPYYKTVTFAEPYGNTGLSFPSNPGITIQGTGGAVTTTGYSMYDLWTSASGTVSTDKDEIHMMPEIGIGGPPKN